MKPYFPCISTSNLVNRYRIGKFDGHLLDNIESLGATGYVYVLLVFHAGSHTPYFAVASEFLRGGNDNKTHSRHIQRQRLPP